MEKRGRIGDRAIYVALSGKVHNRVEVTLSQLPNNPIGWDTHGQNFDNVRRLSEILDPAWGTLMDDLRQRGLKAEDAVSMIVHGFCKEVFRELPMEFAVEAQKLLGVSLEGSVG